MKIKGFTTNISFSAFGMIITKSFFLEHKTVTIPNQNPKYVSSFEVINYLANKKNI